jgi:hypothetical protein
MPRYFGKLHGNNTADGPADNNRGVSAATLKELLNALIDLASMH